MTGQLVARAHRSQSCLHQLQPGRLERVERFGGGGPAEHPAGPVVELAGDRVDVVLGERGEVGILVQVLAQQPIRRSYVCQAAALVFSSRMAASIQLSPRTWCTTRPRC